MSHLAAKITDEDIDNCMAELRAMLKATRRARAAAQPGETARERRAKFQEIPDYKVRLDAIRLFCQLKNYPTPSLQQVQVRYQHEQAPPMSPADSIKELMRQGADVDTLLGPWIAAMRSADPAPAEAKPVLELDAPPAEQIADLP